MWQWKQWTSVSNHSHPWHCFCRRVTSLQKNIFPLMFKIPVLSVIPGVASRRRKEVVHVLSSSDDILRHSEISSPKNQYWSQVILSHRWNFQCGFLFLQGSIKRLCSHFPRQAVERPMQKAAKKEDNVPPLNPIWQLNLCCPKIFHLICGEKNEIKVQNKLHYSRFSDH